MKTMRKNRISRTNADRIFDALNVFLMLLVIFIMAYPLYFTVIASVSEPYAVAMGHVSFRTVGFTTEAYKNVLANKNVWTGYRNTLKYTFFGTIWNLALTIPAAYVLSKKNLPMRGALMTVFLIPMYVSGGLVPTYLAVRNVGLLNKPYTLIFLMGLNIYNLVVTRVFFQTSIPEDVYESARIDSADDFTIFFRIALPLSMPIVAVMALFFGVARWNDYFTGLIYLSSDKHFTLQQWLRAILIQSQTALAGISSGGDPESLAAAARLAYMAEAMKYAFIFIASAPMLISYPFVQKYFVKGVMIGSLKG